MTEKPLECGACQRQAGVLYQEIHQDKTIKTAMCKDCPILEERLYGGASPQPPSEKSSSLLCCANCLTSLDSIKQGLPLGCSNCYAVFGDVLIETMLLEEETKFSNKPIIHKGKMPPNPAVLSENERIKRLEETLQEALSQERYEEAALLRDQLKKLAEPSA